MEINPSQIATQLAQAYTNTSNVQLAAQNKAQKARTDGLSQLQKALQDFRSALTMLGGKKSMLASSAVLSREGVATATTSASAQAGSYALFVEKLASNHQLAFGNITPQTAAGAGTLKISQQDGSQFSIDLSAADSDGDAALSVTEIARSINQNTSGKVSAMVVTTNGESRLLLSSGVSGANGALTLDTSALSAGLQTALAAPQTLAAAEDAVVWLGGKDTGVRMQQSSNTFTAIQGVTLNLQSAMKDGDAALQLTVSRNGNDTAANVQSFVDAYNSLQKTLTSLTSSGGEKSAAGIFANDASIRGLRDQLNNTVRQTFGNVRLAEMGVSASREGVLSLDRSKLDKLLQDKPTALDSFFSDSNGDGLIKTLRGSMEQWLKTGSGTLAMRRQSSERMQADLDKRQQRIDGEYEQVYKRYLMQFTQLQQMQTKMSGTLDSLNNYFAQQGT